MQRKMGCSDTNKGNHRKRNEDSPGYEPCWPPDAGNHPFNRLPEIVREATRKMGGKKKKERWSFHHESLLRVWTLPITKFSIQLAAKYHQRAGLCSANAVTAGAQVSPTKHCVEVPISHTGHGSGAPKTADTELLQSQHARDAQGHPSGPMQSCPTQLQDQPCHLQLH